MHSFQDHGPNSSPGSYAVADVKTQVEFLNQPGVDIQFTLEDVFEGSGGQVAYRLFGEGTIPLSVEEVPTDLKSVSGSPVKKLGVRGTSLYLDGGMNSVIASDKLHITYRCVGIFMVKDDKFCERWGEIRIE